MKMLRQTKRGDIRLFPTLSTKMAVSTLLVSFVAVIIFVGTNQQEDPNTVDFLCYGGFDQCYHVWCSHYGGVCVGNGADCACDVDAATIDTSIASASTNSGGDSIFAALLRVISGKGGKHKVEHTQTVDPRGTINDLLCIGLDQCTNVWCRLHGGECVGDGPKGCVCDFSAA